MCVAIIPMPETRAKVPFPSSAGLTRSTHKTVQANQSNVGTLGSRGTNKQLFSTCLLPPGGRRQPLIDSGIRIPPLPPPSDLSERQTKEKESPRPDFVPCRFSAAVISQRHHLHGSSSEPKPNSLPSSLALHLPAFISRWPPSPLREAAGVWGFCFSLLGCSGVNTLRGESPPQLRLVIYGRSPSINERHISGLCEL